MDVFIHFGKSGFASKADIFSETTKSRFTMALPNREKINMSQDIEGFIFCKATNYLQRTSLKQ